MVRTKTQLNKQIVHQRVEIFQVMFIFMNKCLDLFVIPLLLALTPACLPLLLFPLLMVAIAQKETFL